MGFDENTILKTVSNINKKIKHKISKWKYPKIKWFKYNLVFTFIIWHWLIFIVKVHKCPKGIR